MDVCAAGVIVFMTRVFVVPQNTGGHWTVDSGANTRLVGSTLA